ncbi:unnamed protein product, partial [Cyprideis torosa]
SDSGGGAGIQADLKTFSACGCYGTSVITAITAQNTLGVSAIHPVPIGTIEAQITAILEDIGTDSVKIGMLHSSEVIETVAACLQKYPCGSIVVDPVMVATSGDKLIEDDAIATMKTVLLPMATLITPNIYEAELLTGIAIGDREDMAGVASILQQSYSTNILLKG